jgi:hypothetical protein
MQQAPQIQLRLLPPAPVLAAATPPDRRKVFWRAYLDWLATATSAETEQFERVLCGHAHHVRPLMDAVSDALRTRENALRLPHTLLACLAASGWRPIVATPRDGWIAA